MELHCSEFQRAYHHHPMPRRWQEGNRGGGIIMADSTTSTPPPRRRFTVESNFHPHDFRHVLPPFQFELKWVVVGGGSGRIAFQSAIFICPSLLLSWAELLRYQNRTIEPPLIVVVVKKYNLIQFAPNDTLFWFVGGKARVFLLE